MNENEGEIKQENLPSSSEPELENQDELAEVKYKKKIIKPKKKINKEKDKDEKINPDEKETEDEQKLKEEKPEDKDKNSELGNEKREIPEEKVNNKLRSKQKQKEIPTSSLKKEKEFKNKPKDLKEEKTENNKPEEKKEKKKKVVKKTVKKIVKKKIPIENINDYPNIISISDSRPVSSSFAPTYMNMGPSSGGIQNNFIYKGPKKNQNEGVKITNNLYDMNPNSKEINDFEPSNNLKKNSENYNNNDINNKDDLLNNSENNKNKELRNLRNIKNPNYEDYNNNFQDKEQNDLNAPNNIKNNKLWNGKREFENENNAENRPSYKESPNNLDKNDINYNKLDNLYNNDINDDNFKNNNIDNTKNYNELKNDDEIKRKLKYYEEKENKYAPSTKDFYELNKDRYMNESSQKDKNKTPKKIENNKAQENLNTNSLNNDTTKSKNKEKTKQNNSSAKKKRINRSAEKRPLKKNINNFYKNEINKEEPELSCCNCGKKENNLINYCDNCRGPICSNCNKQHSLRNPNHKYNLDKLKDLENKKILFNKDKDNNIPKNIILDVCSKCNKPLDAEIASICNNCGGDILCKDCTKNHNIIFPSHDIYNKDRNKKINPNKKEQNKDNKCSQCLRNINNLPNNFIENCPECNKNLCNDCLKDHFSKNPNHLIPKKLTNKNNEDLESDYLDDNLNKDKFERGNLNEDINNNDKSKGKLRGRKDRKNLDSKIYESQFIKCDLCKDNVPFDNNKSILHCYPCQINLCDNCAKNHNKENPSHRPNSLKTYIRNDIVEYPNKCIKCDNNISNKLPLLNCFQCKGNLCNICINDHYREMPNHKISMIKLVNSEDNLEKANQNCSNCGKNINNYQNCDNCNILLCQKCLDEHFTKNPNHSLKINRQENNYPKETDKDNDKLIQYNDGLSYPTINCTICDNDIKFDNNKNLNYCHNCKGNLCKNCFNKHKNDSPFHEINKVKIILSNTPDEGNRALPFLKCNQCKLDLNEKIKEPIQHCSKCNGNLCDRCGNEHYRKKLDHKLSLIQYILPNQNSKDLNCSQCSKNLNKFDDCQKCDICNIYLCDECADNHRTRLHNQSININSQKQNENKEFEMSNEIPINNQLKSIPNMICVECQNLIPINNKNINYCYNCKGNICNDCNSNHDIKYKNHNCLNNIKHISIQPNEDINPFVLLKCNQCNKKLDNNQPIQHCSQCQNNLCEKCLDNHNYLNPEHKVSPINYILPNSFNNDLMCNQYGIDLNNSNNYKNCVNCNNIPLCNECGENHNNENPTHKLRDIMNSLKIKEENKIQKPLINCIDCDMIIPIQDNNFNNYCNDCKGNLYNNCNNNHNNKYPSHNCLNKIKVIPIHPNEDINSLPLLKCNHCNKKLNINQPIQICSQCQNNLCDNCLDNHNNSNPNHEILLIKYIFPNSFNNDSICSKCGINLNNLQNYKNCDNCNIPLCNECGENHNKDNPNHKLKTIRKGLPKRKEEDDIQKSLINCIDCDKIVPIGVNHFIYYCNNCKGKICNGCNINHNNIYPNHIINQIKTILINPDDNNKDKNLKCIKCNTHLINKLNEPLDYCTQ